MLTLQTHEKKLYFSKQIVETVCVSIYIYIYIYIFANIFSLA